MDRSVATRRGLLLAVLLVAAPAVSSAQTLRVPPGATVIDRIVSRPNGEIIMQSDVWQAIDLRLLPPADRTFEAGQRAIENRRLILAEVNRLPAREPDPDALAARRAAWTADLMAAGMDPDGAIARFGMSRTVVDTWLRNDVRIATYLDQRFAATSEADRPAAIADWLGFLRQRAGLR